MPDVEGAVRCARHADTETELRCGRCGTPICPRCMVMTPVGARCPSCARPTVHPALRADPLLVARGVAAGLLAGAMLGAVWGFLLPNFRLLGFFALFIGGGIGYAVAYAIGAATRRRPIAVLAWAAGAGVVAAYMVRSLVAVGTPLPINDLWGYIAVVVGVIVAASTYRR